MSKCTLIMVKNRGSALIIALVFLLVMTLIGTTAMQGTSQQETMAGNMRDRSLAFQAAEAALSNCLRSVQPPVAMPPALPSPPGLINPPLAEGNDPGTFWAGYFQANPLNPSIRLNPSIFIDGTGTTTPPDPPVLANVFQDPSCVIEDMNFTAENPFCLYPTSNCFRITARGFGGTAGAIAIVQSLYYR